MGGVYRRKRFYRTPQRILIHLSSSDARLPSLLPSLTQEGIGLSTRSGRSTVTKWLQRLVARGLIVGEREHVPSHRIRKTVYRLTEAGWGEAARLRNRLSSDTVEVRSPKSGPLAICVADIPGFFSDLTDLTAVVSTIREGRIDLRTPATHKSKEPLTWGDALPRVDRLFGRSLEFKDLAAWYSSRSGLIAVVGLPGIGKSALVSGWISAHCSDANVFWYDVQEWTTLSTLLSDLAAFLARLGRRGLRARLKETDGEEYSALARVLSHDLQGIKALVVVDNLHKATREFHDGLSRFLRTVVKTTGIRVILTSRSTPVLDRWRRVAAAPGPVALRLGGLDLRSSTAMLRACGMMVEDITLRKIAVSTHGHPLLIRLLAKSGSEVEAAQRFIEREMLAMLSEPERSTLEAACIFRGPVSMEALKSMPGVSTASLRKLESKSLLEPTAWGWLSVHDLVREHIRARLPTSRKSALHANAAKYCLLRPERKDHLEALYHLLEAGQSKEAAELLAEEGQVLLDAVGAQEVSRLIAKIPTENLDLRSSCVVAEISGDSLRLTGRLTPAVHQYRDALRRCENGNFLERIPGLLCKIASIERHRGQHAKALGHLVEAMAWLTKHPNPGESAEVLKETGLVEQARGDFEGALRHLEQAVDLATDAADAGRLARSLLVLGTLEAERGDPERGLDDKLAGLRITERSGNVTEAGRAHISIGVTYYNLRKFHEALDHFGKGLELTRLVGNVRLIAHASLNRAAVLLDLERYAEARSPLEESKRLFEILEERDSLAMVDMAQGQLEMGLGRWSRATRVWDRGLQSLREFGNLSDLARSLEMVGRFYIDHGQVEDGGSSLREALAIARKLGNKPMIANVAAEIQASAASVPRP